MRRGRPGLLGTVARTAVISGTATRVSGGVAHRQAERFAAQQAAPVVPQVPVAPPAPATPAPGAVSTEERLAQLERLAALHSAGILTDAELAAEKARILA